MALSVNTPQKIGYGDYIDYPVAASSRIYKGSMVGVVKSTGYVRALTAGDIFVGHSLDEYDNTSGAAAAIDCRVSRTNYTNQVAITGVSVEDIGRKVFASDDATCTFDPTGTSGANSFVGVLKQYVSSGYGVVEFCPHGNSPESVITFFDDFLGYAANKPWTTVDVNGATESITGDVHGGVYKLNIANTTEAEDAVLYFGDELSFDIDKMLKFKCRARVTTPASGITVVLGMAGAHNLDKDTVAQHAWFRCEGGLDCKAESDDGTNDNDDKTVATITTAVWYDFEIDMTNSADVKFFVNGSAVATGTTFDMSNYTAGLQPYFSCDKGAVAGTAALEMDYVEVTAIR